jgi:hypothetical protein
VTETSTYKIADESTGQHCGYDYQSFSEGFDCPKPAVKVVMEHVEAEGEAPEDFHVAHLCEKHAEKVLEQLQK